ncbi:MAG: Crp/Fnr family transcriptional regulator [Reichenbachiella sp.]
MQQSLITHFSEKVPLTNTEIDSIVEEIEVVKFKKKKDVLRAGEVCHYIYFVKQGCLRSFSIDNKGVEHVSQLAFEQHWISDLYSFLTKTNSTLFIESLEETELLRLSSDALNRLYEKVPVLEKYFRMLFQSAYVAQTRRLNETLIQPADTRYQSLIQGHPDVNQRIPLIHIASYLGIMPESLSRIRKKRNA